MKLFYIKNVFKKKKLDYINCKKNNIIRLLSLYFEYFIYKIRKSFIIIEKKIIIRNKTNRN